ncbi:MAG: N-acetylmuramoyl-L-alanine amidase [Clostridia bacterium]|nr:N-acetylmuramoyl-L-alanine amidase [Clostridia bacterium]
MPRVCVDAGHGGHDSGAIYGSLVEKNINLTVAKEVARLLKLNGIDVILTREQDLYLDLNQRSVISNVSACDLFVSIHHNAGGGDRGEVIHSVKSGKSKELAYAIAEEFKAIGQSPVNIYSKANSVGGDYFAVIRNTKAPSVITEFCFLDSKDNQIIDSLEEQLKEAKAIAKGICRVLSIKYNDSISKTDSQTQVANTDTNLGILKKGSTGQQVKDLQTQLNKLGYNIVVDGIFGLITENAVKDFQRKKGLVVDGIVGEITTKYLFS